MRVRVEETVVRWAWVDCPDEELDVVSSECVEPTAEGRDIIFDQVYGNWTEDVLECNFYNADEE